MIALLKSVKLAFNCKCFVHTFTKVGLYFFDDNQYDRATTTSGYSSSNDTKLWQPKNLPHTNHCVHLYATSHSQEKLHFTNSTNGRKKILEFNTPSVCCWMNEWMSEQSNWYGDLVVTVHRYAHRLLLLFFFSFFLSFFNEWLVHYVCVQCNAVCFNSYIYIMLAKAVQNKISAKRKIYLHTLTFQMHINR